MVKWRSKEKDEPLFARQRYFFCILIVILIVGITIAVVTIRDASERSGGKNDNLDKKDAHDYLYDALYSRKYTWEIEETGAAMPEMSRRTDHYRPSGSVYENLGKIRKLSIEACPQGSENRGKRSSKSLSAMAIVFGQFIDHDIVLTKPVKDDDELEYDIAVPRGDPVCKSSYHDIDPMHIFAVQRDTGAGDNQNGYAHRQSSESPEQYARSRPLINFNTPELDLSTVYGSTRDFARNHLRDNGRCELRTGANYNLPVNDDPEVVMENENDDPNIDMLIAGDIRANEQLGLLAFQTWWVNLHNVRCKEVRHSDYFSEFCRSEKAKKMFYDDEEECYYTIARLQQIAVYQKIIYEEWLPAMLGEENARQTQCYDYPVEDYYKESSMFSESAAQLFRLHNIMPNDVVLANRQMQETGRQPLCRAFFDPTDFVDGKISYRDVVAGSALEQAMEMNECMVDCLNNQLFGRHCMDLGSLNMARYYVEDIPSLSEVRDTLDLKPGLDSTFDQLYPHNPEFSAMLEKNFNGRVQDVPTWLLASAEKAKGDSAVGETITRATVKQFREFCRYDTTYYERMHEDLKPKEMYKQSAMAEMMYKVGVVERGSLEKAGKQENPFYSF